MRGFERLQRLLGIRHGIIQAPMAGGVTTVELVAAVSNAGGLGSLGAAYLSPEEIAEAVSRIRALTPNPFAAGLFAGGPDGSGASDPRPIRERLRPHFERLGVRPPPLPGPSPSFEAQADVLLRARVPVLSFTFGIPDRNWIAAFRQGGSRVIGTATTAAEARALQEAGVNAVVLQGSEAGGHRGSFLRPLEDSLVGGMALIPRAADTVSIPVIASGGIMDGRGIAAAQALGASGVQLGTAFLACEESGAAPAYKEAVRAAADDATTLTRAFSGRLARGIANGFVRTLRGSEAEILPYPLQNALTRPLRAAAARRGDTDAMSLWAGQAASLAREGPAAAIVESLVEETDAVRARTAAVTAAAGRA